MAWPPTLTELKDDELIPIEDELDDPALTRRLNAAIRFVERVRRDAFVTDDFDQLVLPATYSDQGLEEAESLELGTLMLASRLFARRRSRDAILWMADTGTTRVPAGDADIERLLRVGRHGKARVG